MHDVAQAEATALLARPHFCYDPPSWKPTRLRPGIASIECGLVQEDGSRAGLQVQLLFSRSPKTKIATFKFSVFKSSLGGIQRVYQLQVNALAHAPKSAHDLAHEHFGDARLMGKPEWLRWGFAEALDYFCSRANIAFVPPVNDPEHFELKS